MARALLLTPEVEKEVKALIERAAAEPLPFAENQRLVEARANGQTINLDNARFTMVIPRGYHVTYTHEYQREDLVCRHISVSVENAQPKTGPNPMAVVEILRLFGFKNQLGHMPGWVSKHPNGSLIIELLEPVDGDVGKLAGGADV